MGCSKGEQLIVTFAAGYIAGVFCAIVSHPADTLVSYLNKAPGAGIGAAVNTLGFSGLWAGLGPRIVMIGTLTALQWFIYDGEVPPPSSPPTSPRDACISEGQDGCCSVLNTNSLSLLEPNPVHNSQYMSRCVSRGVNI